MRYQLSEHSLINFNINIAIFAYQYFLINALSSSVKHFVLKGRRLKKAPKMLSYLVHERNMELTRTASHRWSSRHRLTVLFR